MPKAYLDIETTGLSPACSIITVIGTYPSILPENSEAEGLLPGGSIEWLGMNLLRMLPKMAGAMLG